MKLILMRHAEVGYLKDRAQERVTDLGRQQIELRYTDISRIVGCKFLLDVVSSSDRKAVETAVLLVQQEQEEGGYMTTGFMRTWEPLCLDEPYQELAALLDIHREERASDLIAVTHLEVVREFPDYYSAKRWQRSCPPPPDWRCDYLSMALMDLDKETITYCPPAGEVH